MATLMAVSVISFPDGSFLTLSIALWISFSSSVGLSRIGVISLPKLITAVSKSSFCDLIDVSSSTRYPTPRNLAEGFLDELAVVLHRLRLVEQPHHEHLLLAHHADDFLPHPRHGRSVSLDGRTHLAGDLTFSQVASQRVRSGTFDRPDIDHHLRVLELIGPVDLRLGTASATSPAPTAADRPDTEPPASWTFSDSETCVSMLSSRVKSSAGRSSANSVSMATFKSAARSPMSRTSRGPRPPGARREKPDTRWFGGSGVS